MMRPGALALLLCPLGGLADDQALQRALIQRDQQSAEFAARLRGPQEAAALERLHAIQLRDAGRPLDADPATARQLLPYERSRMAEERVLVFSPPQVKAAPTPKPLPLPGGPAHGVDPIPPQGLRD